MRPPTCPQGLHPPRPTLPRRATEDQWLLYDAMRAQLLDPEFANDTVHFVELQARVRVRVWVFVGLLVVGLHMRSSAAPISESFRVHNAGILWRTAVLGL